MEQNLSCATIQRLAFDTLVIGTGCAGYNAADTLYDLGRRSVAILTEGVLMGTSRNTGSDKQTYYKLSLCGAEPDSIQELAQNLYDGGAVEGEIALAEAAGSIRSFMKLVNLGVPFPTNNYGEYVGYKTDHDPKQRATSCGPLTSKIMTEKLEKSVKAKKISIFDKTTVVRLVKDGEKICGVIALDVFGNWYAIAANHVVLATGGPAIAYEKSVYPTTQTGMSGLAIEAGAAMNNMCEWQYGLASIGFRWNVSGSYQQVLPRYVAVSPDGTQREFLPEYFERPEDALNMVFLKGYQWPFDTKKLHGSSIIDVIVHHEIFDLGNRVFMDFRQDPKGLETGFDRISEQARTYLVNSNATQKTPIERLAAMNPKAIELYRSHKIDLWTEMLEVAVCAQHCNGGVLVDANWQSTVPGLYVAGEAAGTFGISRPGGSALNSTQVGSQRAAEHIAFSSEEEIPAASPALEDALQQAQAFAAALSGNSGDCKTLRSMLQHQMSMCASYIRKPADMAQLQTQIQNELSSFEKNVCAKTAIELIYAFKTRDMMLTQLSMLDAMHKSAQFASTRGSAMLLDAQGEIVSEALPDYRVLPAIDRREYRMETVYADNVMHSNPIAVSPIPQRDDWFERVWNDYNQRRKNI